MEKVIASEEWYQGADDTERTEENTSQKSTLLKDFSRENDPKERLELAREIKLSRKERRSELNAAKVEKESTVTNLEAIAQSLTDLANVIEGLSQGHFARLINFKKLKDLRTQLAHAESLKIVAESKVKRAGDIIQRHIIDQGNTPDECKDSKKKIEDFYSRQMEKWKTSPYDASDIEKYFNKEYLSGLSIEDYQVLLGRFSSGMVTHVTRQGIRDHIGMMEHSVGVGKVWNGFKELIKEHELKHNLDLRITEEDKEAAIARYFDLAGTETKEEALSKLNRFVGLEYQHHAGSFIDFHSLHFAVKSVGDAFYGGESGNEIFIAYPSYMMAANHFHRRDPHTPAVGVNYNDVWVYVAEDDSMPVDAGVVFIPKNAAVNPEHGSRYEIGEGNEAIPDLEKIKKIAGIIKMPEFIEFGVKLQEKIGEMPDGFSTYKKIHLETYEKEWNSEMDELLNTLRSMFQGITEEDIDIIMDYVFLDQINRVNSEGLDREIEDVIEVRLMKMGIYYKSSSTTVTSQEYWEKYFNTHPTHRPSKIVYYEGGNPTQALHDWQFNTKQSSKPAYALENNHHLTLGDKNVGIPEVITKEMQRFKAIVEKVIDDFYQYQ
ncbi:MAG: hypothetical protein RIQ72_367 [Candidatus Parcubacteria bacterium]|jgi:transcriptional regulator with XRE-family HTH domain